MERELIDIGSLIRKAAATALRDTKGRGLALDIPLDTLHVHGHHAGLGAALTALFTTALDTVPGEGDLTVSAAVKQGGTLLLMGFKKEKEGDVSPEGVPIAVPEEALKSVLKHGGSIKGDHPLAWEVELPLAVIGGTNKQQDMEDPKGKCRVLVVDDNVDGAVTLSVIIKHLGHSVRITHDGAAAMTVAQEFRPELILMDIGMPGMDGYETCQRMREEEWSNGVHIVALTGWGQEEDKRKAMRAGFDRHLVKPVDRKTLMEVLSSVPVAAAGEGRSRLG